MLQAGQSDRNAPAQGTPAPADEEMASIDFNQSLKASKKSATRAAPLVAAPGKSGEAINWFLADKERLFWSLQIAGWLGFTAAELAQLQAAVQAHHQRGASAQPKKPSIDQSYAILGVDKGASDAEVKKAYRRLMSQHHPDKLVAKGLPEEMMKVATEKTHEIRQAYEAIKAARGF